MTADEHRANHAAGTADLISPAVWSAASGSLGSYENQRQAFAASITENEATLQRLRADVAALESRSAVGEAVAQELLAARERAAHDGPILDYLIDQARGVVASCERSIAAIQRALAARLDRG